MVAASGTRRLTLAPSEIRFTHDKISQNFSCGRGLEQTVADLRCDPDLRLPKMIVVRHDPLPLGSGGGDAVSCDTYWCMSNRRLWCYRQVSDVVPRLIEGEHFQLEQAPPSAHFHRGLSTKNDGSEVTFWPKNHCERCEKNFASRPALLQHLEFCQQVVQPKPERYACKICRAKFESPAAQLQHTKECRKRLEQAHPAAHTSTRDVTEEFPLPESCVGRVIGSGGTGLLELRRMAGVVDVKVVSNKNGGDALRVVGVPECVKHCGKLVSEIAKQCERSPAPGGVERVFTVPADKVGQIIGKGGETITRLRELSGVHSARFDKQTAPDGGPGVLRVTGKSECVDEFFHRLQTRLGGGPVGEHPGKSADNTSPRSSAAQESATKNNDPDTAPAHQIRVVIEHTCGRPFVVMTYAKRPQTFALLKKQVLGKLGKAVKTCEVMRVGRVDIPREQEEFQAWLEKLFHSGRAEVTIKVS
mmetsp:Transcript_49779/g.131999  ORF Transcript_49779/g.131999 Transcript_49779/m.131999 type:complete len:473 (-) Transcript_49779:192-1610(-)